MDYENSEFNEMDFDSSEECYGSSSELQVYDEMPQAFAFQPKYTEEELKELMLSGESQITNTVCRRENTDW